MSEPKWEPDTPITDALIQRVMDEFPGVSKITQARYYEEVHQELAPLARQFERELTVLREKCEELNRIKNDTAAEWQKELACANDLQRQLDEAAKQEPVGRFCKSDGGTLYPEGIWTEVNELYSSEDCVPLFRHPPNLPALIEQARAEVRAEYEDVVPRSRMNAVDAEMLELKEKLRKYYDGAQLLIEQAKTEKQEQIGKLIHYPKCWDTSAYPTLEAALMEIHHCSQCYENRNAAIRARSGK